MINRRTFLASTGGAALSLALPPTRRSEPELWAVYRQSWVGMRRTRDASCPRSGWMHEGKAPWRVIVSTNPGQLPFAADHRLYTGDEPTLDWDVYVGEPMKRIGV